MILLPEFANAAVPSTRHVPLGNISVDWSHPLTRSLEGCWVPSVKLANLVDSSILQVIGASTTNFFIKPDIVGPCWTSPNQTGGVGLKSLGPTYLSGKPNWSIFYYGRMVGYVNSDSAAIYCERALTGNDIIQITMRGSTYTLWCTIRNDAGTLLHSEFTGAFNPGDNKIHTVAVTRQGSGGSGNVIAYVDGVQFATLSWTGNDTYTNANVATLFYDIADPGSSFQGSMATVMCWSRVLTPDEVAFLNFNPFALVTSNEMPMLNVAGNFWQLYFSKNAGAYEPVTTTSIGVKSADASSDADETKILIPRL